MQVIKLGTIWQKLMEKIHICCLFSNICINDYMHTKPFILLLFLKKIQIIREER